MGVEGTNCEASKEVDRIKVTFREVIPEGFRPNGRCIISSQRSLLKFLLNILDLVVHRDSVDIHVGRDYRYRWAGFRIITSCAVVTGEDEKTGGGIISK